MDIVLFSDDVNLLSHWEISFEKDVVVLDDLEELKKLFDKFIVINYSSFGSSEKETLKILNEQSNLVLVLDRTPDIKTAREVLSYGAKGYGNAMMREHFLLAALETMKDGLVWLHPELTSVLIAQLPKNGTRDISSIIEVLSEREKEVVYLLRDGDTYKVVAQKLDITPRTVKAHAHHIYVKLRVKDRLSLATLLK